MLKLKPLFDAYYGPYKVKCFIWTGLLLVARLMLVITASLGSIEIYRSVTIATVIGLFAIIAVLQGVYKSQFNNYLECTFMLYASMIAAFVQFSHYVTVVGVSLSAMTFLGISFYHYYLWHIKQKRRCTVMTNSNKEITENLLSFAEPTAESNMPTVSKSVVEICTKEDPNLTRRRETLLLENDSNSHDSSPYNLLK